MKLHEKIVTAVGISLLFSHCAWPQNHAPLDIQISLLNGTVLLGEPAWVDVRITNLSDELLRIDPGNECYGNQPLKVRVPAAEPGSGEHVSCRIYGGSLGSCMYNLPRLVAPGQTITRRYVLSGDFRITHPGSYSVLLEKTVNYAPALPEGASENTPEPQEEQTASVQVTLDVQPANPEKLLAIEEELARKAAEPVPEATPPALPQEKPLDKEAYRAREIRDNTQWDAILMRAVIFKGLAAYPAVGMEPVFRKWVEKGGFGFDGLAGLKRLNTPAAREALAAIAASAERQGQSWFSSARSQAVDALADMGDPSYLPLLEKLTRDSDINVRRSAIGALGRLGGEQELTRLTALAHDGKTNADRYVAINAIGDSHSLKAVPILIGLAALPDSQEPTDSYFGLLTLTHLRFPAPDHRPVAEVQRSWMEFWRSREQGAQAYSRYDCPNPVVLGELK